MLYFIFNIVKRTPAAFALAAIGVVFFPPPPPPPLFHAGTSTIEIV
jgi:hypothetical protein